MSSRQEFTQSFMQITLTRSSRLGPMAKPHRSALPPPPPPHKRGFLPVKRRERECWTYDALQVGSCNGTCRHVTSLVHIPARCVWMLCESALALSTPLGDHVCRLELWGHFSSRLQAHNINTPDGSHPPTQAGLRKRCGFSWTRNLVLHNLCDVRLCVGVICLLRST